MSVASIADAQKLMMARQQPNLCFMAFSVVESLADIKAARFSDLSHQVPIHFVNVGPLACVHADEAEPVFYLHQILNHYETPLAVISHICKHELLHLRMPSIKANGKWQHYPPAF